HRAPAPAADNLEQALRRIRYEFFARARAEHRLERVATGHTRSDQAETVLLRLARGAGNQGLAGIHPVTASGIIRPLLEIGRGEIREWLQSQGLAWREDSSNLDPQWRRNRVRQEILPLLAAALNPRIEEMLARSAALAWEDEQQWRRRVAELMEELAPGEPPVVVESDWLRRLGPALGRRVVRQLLWLAAGRKPGLAFEHLDAVWRLATGPEGKGRAVVPGAVAWRSHGWVRFQSAAQRQGPHPGPVVLTAPGEVVLGCWRIAVDRTPDLAASGRYNEVSELAPAAAEFPLTVRLWRPGDRFQPAGREEPVKLKELFQQSRIPSWERAEWPMVEAAGRIVWCRGFGAAAWAVPGRGEAAGLRIAAAREK
ncbi:MAG: tRNA lysidine(34) synthetase TilS, partial [Bryobacteraceae bacterium]